jgi:hemerythrin-like domain-containing protein
MARSTPSRTSDAPRDAIALLKQDHRAVEQLFKQFEAADDDELATIAERVCQLLTVHAQIEEEILYPAAKEEFDDEDDDLVNEAQVEHNSAKDLIAKIEAMTPEDETFKATVKVLSEYIKHHVKEEETELFPKIKKTDLDLKEMGSELAERKMALMEELGIDEEAPAESRKRASGAARASAKARATRAKSGGRSARH